MYKYNTSYIIRTTTSGNYGVVGAAPYRKDARRCRLRGALHAIARQREVVEKNVGILQHKDRVFAFP